MKAVHVAVGVIQNSQGQICVAKRPEGKHLSGLWEFPGGKVETGETTFAALKRELFEELSIDIGASESLIKVDFEYPEKKVLLDVHLVTHFSGEAEGSEGQEVCWVGKDALNSMQFPEANEPIIRAILDR